MKRIKSNTMRVPRVVVAAGRSDWRSSVTIPGGRRATTRARPWLGALGLSALAVVSVFGHTVADASAAGTASQIHLSWVQDPSSSFTAVWHTPAGNAPAFVEYREAGSGSWRKQAATSQASPGSGHLHSATVTGLMPASAYEYRVSNDAGVEPPVSPVYRTRTAPHQEESVYSFAFISDTGIAGRLDGNANGTRQIIEQLVAADPLFVLGGGDYAYANNDPRFANTSEAVDAWFRQMEPLLQRAPFMPQYGNHEISLVERYHDWAPRLALPAGGHSRGGRLYDVRQDLEDGLSYSFAVGAVHFTGLFVPDADLDPETLVWLDRDLAAARARGAKWLIVFHHEPLFAHGYVHPSYPRVREAMGPILEKHDVDLHLSSHDQSYERTLPLRGLPQRLKIASSSLDEYQAGAGVMYLKISPSGKRSERKNDFSRFLGPKPEYMAVRNDTMHHYAIFTVDGTDELRAEIYGVVGGSSQKQVVDAFRIRRGDHFDQVEDG